MSARDVYEAARAEYHRTGALAKGTPKNSPERKAYKAAEKAYHVAGVDVYYEKRKAAKEAAKP